MGLIVVRSLDRHSGRAVFADVRDGDPKCHRANADFVGIREFGGLNRLAVQQGLAGRIAAQQDGSLILKADFAVLGRNRWQGQPKITASVPSNDGSASRDREGPIALLACLHDQCQLHVAALVGCLSRTGLPLVGVTAHLLIGRHQLSRLHVLDHTSPGPDPKGPTTTAEAVLEGVGDVVGCVQGLYVHVPFCVHRCHYCDFFTIAGRDQDREAYVVRLLDEAAAVLPRLPVGIETVFIGGGTPTHLPVDALATLLEGLNSLLTAAGHPVREWTVEANPDTVTRPVADVLAGGGVNRVSLGAQSFEVAALAALERRHNPASVPIAMDHLRAAGIEDLSLDLIFGVPGQTEPLAVWRRDLAAAVSLQPSHLSCYGLTYEAGTPLRRRLETGSVERVDQSIEADQYQETIARLGDAGFEQYEISSWAQPGRRCLHNEAYWLNHNWWPLGPSASGHVNGTRWRNVPRLGPWLAGSGLPAIDTVERLDADGQAGELLMLGLRRLDGVPQGVVESACQTPERGAGRLEAIERHINAGLLIWTDGSLRLTPRGLLLADGVMGDLL